MAEEKHIQDLREILAKAAARDEELERELQAIAAELLEHLGADDKTPVWAEIKAGDHERQVGPHFVLADKWFRGDLLIMVAPDKTFVVSLMIRQAAKGTHEVTLRSELSQTVTLDPPDEKDRAKAHEKLFEHVYNDLEAQVRQSVALPLE